MISIIIPGEFTDLNTYVDAERSNRFVAAKLKRTETERTVWQTKRYRYATMPDYPVHMTFTWYTKNLRKDADNIAFAKKFILDGLVSAEVLKGDGRKFVGAFSDYFFVDPENPRVEILITHLQ